MKKIFLSLVLALVVLSAKSQDFSAVCETGQTLYYTISDKANHQVTIVAPSEDPDYPWSGFTAPSGKIIIPNTVTNNGVEYVVTRIGYETFKGCGITELTIPNTVMIIDYYAFEECYRLKELFIPSSVAEIGDRAFSRCDSLEKIEIDPKNLFYDSRDNCNAIIKTETNTLICGCKNTVIPNSVTEIFQWAFYFCEGITSIDIPNSVTKIGGSAFDYCKDLKTVTFSNSLKVISGWAFASCENLTEITIPNSVKEIGGNAFSGCQSLKSLTLSNSLKKIEGWTFKDCVALEAVIIPNSVTSIDNDAFAGCTSLKSLTIPESVTSISGRSFAGCYNLEKITVAPGNTKYNSNNNCNAVVTNDGYFILGCKNSVIPEGVICITNHAFSGCSGLTQITIPNTVKYINHNAFVGCSGLTEIVIPSSVTYIEGNAFGDCIGLKSLVLPESIKYINNSFNGCSGLETLTIPNSVIKIYNGAFSGCSSLKTLTIPSSVSKIENRAFSGCNGLEKIVVDPENQKYDSRNNCNAIIDKENNELILGCRNTIIPNDVTSIGDEAFSGEIGKITIPASVKMINDIAFWECVKTVTVHATTPPELGINVFYEVYSPWGEKVSDEHQNEYKLIVPCGCKQAYEESEWGSYFPNIIEDCK